jgi:formate hydrogenlyase subunit 3/multisubunit Na+/H+ antiporter MnhD subunit
VTGIQAGLLAQLAFAVAAVLVAVVAPAWRRNLLAGTACATLGAAGAATGALALAGRPGAVEIPTALPLPPVLLAPDALGGLFIILAGVVGLLASVYAIGYAHGASASRSQWAALAVFLLGLQTVPAAADVVSFLLAWELMAVASTVLVLADQARNAEARRAATWYAVMTHLSFLLALAGFAVLAGATGGTAFAVLANADPSSAAASVAFALLAAGFAAKAGLVPLHVWLPRAHPEAPSHASALMSAAMVKMGVYGLLLVTLRLLPGGPTLWAVVLVVLGGTSAIYGILEAAVATDVKRLLAYSTTENVGLIVLALGVALLLRGYRAPGAASAALVACLLLVVSHGAFKATLFLGAGSILHGTGERNLDRLGGLVHPMPWTAAAFGVGCLGAAALPVTAGFVAEWTLFQALIHAVRPENRLVAVVVPLALAVIALTAGLALVTFVKAYGIAFLARPRSVGALAAHESPASMRVALIGGAGAVVALGLAPGPVATVAAGAVGVAGVRTIGLTGLELTGVDALLDPAALVALGALVAIPALVLVVALARRRPAERDAVGWGCGAARTSPRMQYTATSYAEPLMRIFDDALQPTRDVEVTHVAESRYMAERVRYRQRVEDVVEARLYRPLVAAADAVADRARRIQNGSIHRYLAFSFAALVIVLVVVAR